MIMAGDHPKLIERLQQLDDRHEQQLEVARKRKEMEYEAIEKRCRIDNDFHRHQYEVSFILLSLFSTCLVRQETAETSNGC